MSFVVVKVGGSLFDLPDFKIRMQTWIKSQEPHRLLLVAGGGRLVDAIRQCDRLDEDASHWLAIEAMHVNAMMLAALLSDCIVRNTNEAETAWRHANTAIFDPRSFCRGDMYLPCSWSVTSDSIAARVAVRYGASELILLKSATPPNSVDDWASCGYCDTWLARVLAGSHVVLRAVNLREMPI